MRKNFGAQTWMYPMPVLIVGTYDENGRPDAMNAAWGGIYETNQIMLCLSENHKADDHSPCINSSCIRAYDCCTDNNTLYGRQK